MQKDEIEIRRGIILYDLSLDDYLKHPAIGSSSLQKIMLTPADFLAAKELSKTDTKATIKGSAVHCLILEPHDFANRYALQPEDWGPRNVGEGRKKWDEFKKYHDGKICLGYEDAFYLRRLQKVALELKVLQNILSNGKTEVTAITQKTPSIELKARADLLTENAIWDVKTTTENIDDDNLAKIIINNGYHFQAAQYLNVFSECGLERKSFGWIFVSTSTPYPHIRLVKASSILLQFGMSDFQYALNKLYDCYERNEFPGYAPVISEIQLPEWVLKIYQ